MKISSSAIYTPVLKSISELHPKLTLITKSLQDLLYVQKAPSNIMLYQSVLNQHTELTGKN